MSYMGPVRVPWDINFFTLEKQDNDFFGVFSYGTGAFFSKIIFREISMDILAVHSHH